MREEKSVTVMGEEISFLLERKRVKRLNLRVRWDGSVYVSAPPAVPLATVLTFVRTNIEFIRRARASLAALPALPPLGEGSRVYYLGEPYVLHLVRGERTLLFRDGVASLSLPRATSDAEKTYRAALSEQFLPVVTELCTQLETQFPHLAGYRREIRLREMKSMWGNCRPREGRLTFSLALAQMPLPLIAGVVAHEYTHFLVPSPWLRWQPTPSTCVL